jgi:hypothetical protein
VLRVMGNGEGYHDGTERKKSFWEQFVIYVYFVSMSYSTFLHGHFRLSEIPMLDTT